MDGCHNSGAMDRGVLSGTVSLKTDWVIDTQKIEKIINIVIE